MVRNSSLYGRRVGLYTAIGITSSSLIHKSYTLLGFGLIVSQTPWLYLAIKYCGSFYLFYLGVSNIFHVFSPKKPSNSVIENASLRQELTSWGGFRNGFFVDLMNPSASLSFVCIVASTVSVSTGIGIRFSYVLILITTSLVWYCLLAMTFSHGVLMRFNARYGFYVELVMGSFLIYLGGKLFFTPLPENCVVFQDSIARYLLKTT